MTQNPFAKGRKPAPAPVAHPGKCGACADWSHPFTARRDPTAGRCRNPSSPYGGLPRLGWMGCHAFAPRARKEASE